MSASKRPGPVIVAAVGAITVAVCLVGLGIASGVSGHGGFSLAVAAMLIGYGLILGLAGVALWRGQLLGRGPVLALSVLNVLSGPGLAAAAPWLWVLVALSAVTAVAAALPATGRALRLREPDVTPPDVPQQTGSQ